MYKNLPNYWISNTKKFAKTGFNFQIGTAFYLGPTIANFLRFGLDATWFDLSFATLNPDYFDNTAITLDMKFVGIGPLVSISPMRKIAIDTYLKAMPTIHVLAENNSYAGASLTYLFGIGLRFKKFNVGLETNGGKVNLVSTNDANDTAKVFTNNARFYIGFRF